MKFWGKIEGDSRYWYFICYCAYSFQMRKSLNIEPLLLIRTEKYQLKNMSRGVQSTARDKILSGLPSVVSLHCFRPKSFFIDTQTLGQKAFLRPPTTTMTFFGHHRFTGWTQ